MTRSFHINQFRLFASFACFLCSAELYSQQISPAPYSANVRINYIRTWDAVIPMTDANKLIATIHIDSFKVATQYLDGLGRPIQTVMKQGSLITGASPVDMVTSNLYDSFGREQYKYLPFAANNFGGNTHISDGLFKLNPFQQDSMFNKSIFNDETFYYNKTVFDESPLKRVLEVFAPGNNWVGTSGQAIDSNRRSVKTKRWVNTIADSVRVWKVTDVSGGFGTYSSSSIYSVGKLFKAVSTDEHYKQVIEFTDNNGNLILKKVQITGSVDTGAGKNHSGWICTYYIYDDLRQLRCVIQPKAVEILATTAGWDMGYTNGILLIEQCFRYEYDNKGRMIMKKEPGSGTSHMIYDARNRLVMSQDSLLRASQRWMYMIYDGLNRPTITGLITDPYNYGDAAFHRIHADTSITWPVISSYTNVELTRTYYDDYDWRSGEGNPLSAARNNGDDSYFITASNVAWPYPQTAATQSNHLKGFSTGTKTRVLGTSSFLYTVTFYDDKGRVVQVQNKNISNGTDIISTQYTWAGIKLLTIARHEKAGTNSQTSVVVSKITYDELWRVSKVEKKISNSKVNNGNMPGSWTIINQNYYDALGNLTKKKLGATPVDSLVYEYNIRGSMLGMNRAYVKDTTSTTNLFGFDLGYDKTNFLINGNTKNYAAPQFNGNIAGLLWKSTGDDQLRKYDFIYDAVNRLTAANFNQLTNNNFSKNAKIDFSVFGITYDANGNIITMNQRGFKLNDSYTIDSLLYTYYLNSNKLQNIIDKKNDSVTTLGDFRSSVVYMNSLNHNKTTAATDYVYDASGSLSIDNNKDITAVLYNHLNLPDSIRIKSKGTIKYTYDALGNKLKKVTIDSTGSTPSIVTTLYLFGNYVNEILQFIPTGEGRARVNKDTSLIVYDYFIKDHLGNIRMVLTEQKDTAIYPLVTFEQGGLANDTIYYENVTIGRARRPDNFYSNATNGDTVQLLRSSTTRIGAGKLLKVMAKDKLHIHVDYYIPSDPTDNSNPNGLSSVLTILASLLNNSSTTTAFHGGGSSITTDLNNNSPFTDFLAPQGTGQSSSLPKAYLNILFFDEQFRFVSTNSEIIQVSTKGSGQTITRISGSAKEAVKNGYVYVYVSNESNNFVYFDNFQVTHERGPITEETHYYPFGLTMSSISTRALNFGEPRNKCKYNAKEEERKEFADGSGLEWLNYGARMYDVQIGRFFKQDRFAFSFDILSPYQYAANNPISYIDINGDFITIDKFDSKGNLLLSVLYEDGIGYVQRKDDKGNITKQVYTEKDKFILQAIADLKEISKYEHGFTFVSDLQKSKEGLSISGNAVFNGHYSSRRIAYDQREFEADDVTMKNYFTLAHELAHAWANMIGQSWQFDGNPYSWWSRNFADAPSNQEVFGVRFENYIRAMSGEKKMRMKYGVWPLKGHGFEESTPEYFKNFQVPYRNGELWSIRFDANKEQPGLRMDATYNRINMYEVHDERAKKITYTQSRQ